MFRSALRHASGFRSCAAIPAAVFLLASFSAASLPVLAAAPQATAVAVERAPDLAALDAYFGSAGEAWPVPGFSVAIVKDGRVVFEKGYGVRDAARGGSVDEHTMYAIASNSKAFTAAALATQVDEGRLSWDDRVVDHLPWFELYDPYVSREMRIRDLLSHRAGLGTYSGDLLWYGTPYTAEDIVRRARHLPPAYPFRAGYGYTNLMFITAGEVVRAVSGNSWHDFVQERFFEPLGMDRTVTSVSDLATRDNVATPHKNDRGEVIPLDWFNWDAMGAAGGIISSVHDMAQWMLTQLGEGEKDGVRVFSEGAQQQMWRVHNPLAVSRGYKETFPSTHFRGYGLGWSLADYKGRKVVSHGGAYDGMYSRVMLVPEEELGVVVLTNSMTGLPGALAYRVLDQYLGGESPDWSARDLAGWKASRLRFEERQDLIEQQRVGGTSPSLDLEGYTGTYGGDLYGDATVSLEGGRLVLRLLPNPDLTADLEHLHFDTFVIHWRETFAWFGRGTASFVLDASGDVTEMKLDVPNDDLWFQELEMVRRH